MSKKILLGLPPIIIDQSFPRSESDLNIAASALGEIQRLLDEEKVVLYITPAFKLFIEFLMESTDPDWYNRGKNKGIIFSFLLDLFNTPKKHVIDLEKYHFSDLHEFYPHPIPSRAAYDSCIELWAEEVGKFLALHNRYSPDSFFSAIPCAYALAGEIKDTYINPDNLRTFPLSDLNDLDLLQSAYLYPIPSTDVMQRMLRPEDVHNNYKIIGGVSLIRNRAGSSHNKIKFFNKTQWTFSENDDPIPDVYIKQIERKINIPWKNIKEALLTGKKPQQILILDDCSRCNN
jgi:hypothetical protein